MATIELFSKVCKIAVCGRGYDRRALARAKRSRRATVFEATRGVDDVAGGSSAVNGLGVGRETGDLPRLEKLNI